MISMPKAKLLSLDLLGDKAEYSAVRKGLDDGGEHKRMLKTVERAAHGELTGRQLQCLRLMYGCGKSVKEISGELGVAPSTVSRHLKKAKARLKKVMQYYFTRL